MYSLLFHKDVFIPENAQELCNEFQKNLKDYFFSKHFEEHLQNQVIEDRSHTFLRDVVIKCLDSLKTTQREVFELEVSKDYYFFKKSGWHITKFCCRIPYSNTQDLAVAIRPKYVEGRITSFMIVTAWMNSTNDEHFTLDASKYCTEQTWKENLK